LNLSDFPQFRIFDGHRSMVQIGQVDTIRTNTGLVHAQVIIAIFGKRDAEVFIEWPHLFIHSFANHVTTEVRMGPFLGGIRWQVKGLWHFANANRRHKSSAILGQVALCRWMQFHVIVDDHGILGPRAKHKC